MSQTTIEELLEEYRETANTLRIRYDLAKRELRTGPRVRSDAVRHAGLLRDMLIDVLFTVQEIEEYLAEDDPPLSGKDRGKDLPILRTYV